MDHRTRRRAALVVAGVLMLSPVATAGPPASGPFDPLPDGLGPLIVAEQDAGTVIAVHPDGTTSILIGGLVNPRGLALSPDGTALVVVESGSAPDEGALHLVTSGEAGPSSIPLLTGLTFPEGAAFAADGSLAFTSLAPGGVHLLNPDGTVTSFHDGLPDQPIGITLDPEGLVVTSWQGPVVLFDPDMGGADTIVTGPLRGGGHPAVLPGFGVCVPEMLVNEVTCFPFGTGAGLGGAAQPLIFGGINSPVAVGVSDGDNLIVVTGPEGVSIMDRATGDRIAVVGPLFNASGLVVLGEGEDVLTVSPVTTTTTTEVVVPPPAPVTTTTTEAPPPPPLPTIDDGPSLWLGFLFAFGAGGLFALLLLLGYPLWVGLGVGSLPLVALPLIGFGWPMVLLLVLLAAIVGGGGFTGIGRGLLPRVPQPEGGGSFAVYPDPCRDVCADAAEARRLADQAAQKADAAESAARDAVAESGPAGEAAQAAEREAQEARRAADEAARQPDGGSWIEDDRGRIDQHDLQLKRQASRAAWADYQSGAISAGELEATWQELGERDAIERLREKDRQAREERRAEAERRADEAEQQAQEARDEATAADERAQEAQRDAQEAREAANAAEADAAEKEEACRRCLRETAIDAAGGPNSWITQQGGVGGPCDDDEPRTITRTETFTVPDESREVTVEDVALRPQRIDEGTRTGIRRVFQVVAGVIGVGTKVPGTGLSWAGRLGFSLAGFQALAAASILGKLDEAVQRAQQPGGISDYYFVEVTIPLIRVTVTCTCTLRCVNGVVTCAGCTVSEKREPADAVRREEGTRAQVERFIAARQAVAQRAEQATGAHQAFTQACGCG